MKKYILLTVISLCFSLISFAQIQRSFWGVTLGESSRAAVTNYLISNLIDYSVSNGIYKTENINFEDVEWNEVRFYFHNGTFFRLDFSVFGNSDYLDAILSKLQLTLKEKYSVYFNQKISKRNETLFNDGLYVTEIIDEDSQDKRCIRLSYTDLGVLDIHETPNDLRKAWLK